MVQIVQTLIRLVRLKLRSLRLLVTVFTTCYGLIASHGVAQKFRTKIPKILEILVRHNKISDVVKIFLGR